MQNSPPPWYRQFWPWFLIFIPVITVVMSGYLIFLAVNTEDSIVVDDYYKTGKAINQQIAKLENAKSLGIQAQLVTTGTELSIKVTSNKPLDGSALKLDFYHTTMKRFDFSILLTMNGQGLYVAELPEALSGKWTLSLTPFDASWKLQVKHSFPHSSPIPFDQ